MRFWGRIGKILIFLFLPLFITYTPTLTRTEVIEKYVKYAAEAYGIDPFVCLAIAYTENPELDALAVNINRNGTSDVGLFQLNDRCVKEDFIWRYWNREEKFDAMDYRQNTVIAVRHLVALQSQFNSDKNTVMAYNCGAHAVKSGRIPKSTKAYYNRYRSNYEMLKRRTK